MRLPPGLLNAWLFSPLSRLWSDSCQHPLHQPDLHLQMWRGAVHPSLGRSEAAAARRAVRAASSGVENVCGAADGIRKPQQGDVGA